VKNTLLVTALFISLIACSTVSDYAYTQAVFEARQQEQLTYMELNADKHSKYGGYSVEELGEGYEKPVNFLGKVVINVPVINQFPELPVGCESTSAAAVLKYIGYDVSKTEFTEKYLKCSNDFYYNDKTDTLYGPDPNKVFAGDPFKKGYGCYAPVIVNALNDFFNESGSGNRALELKNLNSADMEKLINEGVPLIVWASQDMKSYKYRQSATWIINDSGIEQQWLGNSHTLVLCGYDNNCYYFMDCNNKKEITPYSKTGFMNRWEENGSQCIAVKLDTSDE
jgi:uncharacterized protein YvpB